jgi:hypothetical protein
VCEKGLPTVEGGSVKFTNLVGISLLFLQSYKHTLFSFLAALETKILVARVANVTKKTVIVLVYVQAILDQTVTSSVRPFPTVVFYVDSRTNSRRIERIHLFSVFRMRRCACVLTE